MRRAGHSQRRDVRNARGEVELLAPAKINLYLDVLGKRPDGYHDLRTVMHAIDVCDTVRMRKRKGGISLRCRGLSSPEGPENLALRAANLFLKETGARGGVQIELLKRIPARRGLGGGSSDAAAVLRGMNDLFGARLSQRDLMALAAQIGSDAPFFIVGGTALCEGRGEKVTPIPSRYDFHFVLILPRFGLKTALVYRELGIRDLTPSARSVTILVNAVKRGDVKAASSALYNRLELPSFRLKPQLRAIKERMEQGGVGGFLMSGSGSAIFGLMPDGLAAKCLAESTGGRPFGRLVSVRTFHTEDRA